MLRSNRHRGAGKAYAPAGTLPEAMLEAMLVPFDLLLSLQGIVATHVIPLLPPPGCPPCDSPDQCAVRAVIILVRALMFHPC
jgi:hypothetical protein